MSQVGDSKMENKFNRKSFLASVLTLVGGYLVFKPFTGFLFSGKKEEQQKSAAVSVKENPLSVKRQSKV